MKLSLEFLQGTKSIKKSSLLPPMCLFSRHLFLIWFPGFKKRFMKKEVELGLLREEVLFHTEVWAGVGGGEDKEKIHSNEMIIKHWFSETSSCFNRIGSWAYVLLFLRDLQSDPCVEQSIIEWMKKHVKERVLCVSYTVSRCNLPSSLKVVIVASSPC